MIDTAAECGADIIKFQYHLPRNEMLLSHDWQRLMNDCYLSYPEMNNLMMYTEEQTGMMFLCTPFCREAATDLNNMDVQAFKTGSGEFNNIPFMRHVATFDKPMIISTGMTSRDELIKTLDMVQKINPNIILLNCTSTYPATFAQARLKRINWLRSMSNLPVGQSDHTPTIATALGSIAQGAVVIEKHVTLNKDAEGPDHKASILPNEFKQMVEMGKQIWEGMQDGTEANMGIVREEYEVRRVANHSVVTLVDIAEGDTFTSENVGVKRVGVGYGLLMPAVEYDIVIGYRAAENLTADMPLIYSNIASQEEVG